MLYFDSSKITSRLSCPNIATQHLNFATNLFLFKMEVPVKSFSSISVGKATVLLASDYNNIL
jgi:hypothetical protein